MPGTPRKESSAIIPEKVAAIQLCGLRKKSVAFFFICHFLKLHIFTILKHMGRHTNIPQFKETYVFNYNLKMRQS